jgi:hypothetical protein
MIELLSFILCSLGLSYGWSDTEASRPLRNFIATIPYIHKPLLCHECSSFWISLLLTIFLNPMRDYSGIFISNILSALIGFFVNLYFVRNHLIPFKE